METTVNIPAGLYPQVLGARWSELDEVVRRLHSVGEIVQATGNFRIQHGSNWLTRLLAWIARFPAAGEAVDLRLVITPLKVGEEWRRTFAGHPLVSTQWKRSDGLLAEKMGLFEMRFRLEVESGSLHYLVQSVRLRLGPLSIPMPRWLAPRVTACEKPSSPGTHVLVETRLPLLGLLIAYDGTVTRVETTGQ